MITKPTCVDGRGVVTLQATEASTIKRIVAETADGLGGAGVVILARPRNLEAGEEASFDVSPAIRILGARPGMPFPLRIRIQASGNDDFIDPIFIATISAAGDVTSFSTRTAYAGVA